MTFNEPIDIADVKSTLENVPPELDMLQGGVRYQPYFADFAESGSASRVWSSRRVTLVVRIWKKT